MIRVHVHGASGRLGQAIVRIATDTGGYVVSKSGRKDDLSSPIAGCDVALDVSQPQGSVTIAACCAANGKPLVIGTTRHSAVQLQSLRAGAERVATLLAPNFSVGVNLLFWLTEKAGVILGAEFDPEIVELHHRLKKDSPSGTAKRLGEIIAKTRAIEYDQAAGHGRQGLVGERTRNEVGLQAVRTGEIQGEQNADFAG